MVWYLVMQKKIPDSFGHSYVSMFIPDVQEKSGDKTKLLQMLP